MFLNPAITKLSQSPPPRVWCDQAKFYICEHKDKSKYLDTWIANIDSVYPNDMRDESWDAVLGHFMFDLTVANEVRSLRVWHYIDWWLYKGEKKQHPYHDHTFGLKFLVESIVNHIETTDSCKREKRKAQEIKMCYVSVSIQTLRELLTNMTTHNDQKE